MKLRSNKILKITNESNTETGKSSVLMPRNNLSSPLKKAAEQNKIQSNIEGNVKPKDDAKAPAQTTSTRTTDKTTASPTELQSIKPKNIYKQAMERLNRCSTPKKLVGRDKERKAISDFILKQKGSLYISGCPGTGKTALVNELLPSTDITKVNCMHFCESKRLYLHLASIWNITRNEDVKEDLKKFIFTDGPPIGLVLDEIDQLVTKDNDVLYSLFEWTQYSRLWLIGIANALDLTARFLPRLETRNCAPHVLAFEPYKIAEITEIIKDRLSTLEPSSPTPKSSIVTPSFLGKDQNANRMVMQPMAIEMAARKLAGTGDLRKALDVCRQAISDAESENTSQSTDFKQVTVKHILKAANTMLDSPLTKQLSVLSMPSKMVEHSYRRLCNWLKNGSITASEFDDVINQLESMAFIHKGIKKRNGKTICNLVLSVNGDDVLKHIGNSPTLMEIVKNGQKYLQSL